MTESTSTRRRARRIPAIALFVLALAAGTACTPHQQIAVAFGADAPAAERVAWCESKMDRGAVSPTNDHGLFQINAVHRQEFVRVTGQPWEMVYDGFWNAKYAKHLYDTQGWNPWACAGAA